MLHKKLKKQLIVFIDAYRNLFDQNEAAEISGFNIFPFLGI
jgi:hypothetical protein